MKRVLRAAAVVVLLGLAAAAAAVWVGVRSLDEPVKLAAPLRFKVNPEIGRAHV